MAEQKIELTLSGIHDLQDELSDRKTRVSVEIAERLKEARSLGDLSENSEYDDAKEAQATNEQRIADIEMILKHAKVIEETEISRTRVSLGSCVTIMDLGENEEMTYTLVGATEEDLFKGKMSIESPVGQAIMGKKKGEKVVVKTPSGNLDYKIVKISKPSQSKG